MPGGGLPWQVKAFAGGGENRMAVYKVSMALGAAGVAWWWWSSGKELEQKQAEAVEKFGRHGEKVQYGDESKFKQTVQKEPHFPSIPTTNTNAAGRHAGGTKTP